MRRGPAAVLALVLLASRGTEAGERLRSGTLRLRAGTAEVDLPRTFEPMLPGSFFPDRSRPVEPVDRPVVLILPSSGLTADAAEPFLERGFVVVRLPAGDEATIREALERLGEVKAADPMRPALVAGGRIPATVDRRLGRIAVVRPDEPPVGVRPTVPTAVFVVVGDPTGPLPFDGASGTEVRWYRGTVGLPPELLRDVAEWVAAPDGHALPSATAGA